MHVDAHLARGTRNRVATAFAVFLLSQAAPRADECADVLKSLRELHSSLPESYRGLAQDAANAVGQKVEGGVENCGKFLKACATSPDLPEVRFYYAENLFLLSARVSASLRQELRQPGGTFPADVFKARLADYHRVIATHAQAAFDGLPKESKLRPAALQLIGQAKASADDHVDARAAYEKHLELFPDADEHPSIIAALARVYLDLELYDLGIELTRKSLRDPKLYRTSQYPYIAESLWKLLEAKGDVKGMLAAAQAVTSLYPLRLEESGLGPFLREDFERYIIFNGFRVGYAHFALGEYDAAHEAFQSYISDMLARESRAQAEGGALPPFARIYLKRAEDCRDVIEKLIRRPAPAEFDLSGYWVGKERVSLEAAKGHTLAVVFRGVGDARSAPFIEVLSQWAEAKDDVKFLTVAYLKTGGDANLELSELTTELEGLDYRGAAGFDPDQAEKKIFRAYSANVGSATFVIIGPGGEVLWFQQDPRSIDLNLAKNIIDRIRS